MAAVAFFTYFKRISIRVWFFSPQINVRLKEEPITDQPNLYSKPNGKKFIGIAIYCDVSNDFRVIRAKSIIRLLFCYFLKLELKTLKALSPSFSPPGSPLSLRVVINIKQKLANSFVPYAFYLFSMKIISFSGFTFPLSLKIVHRYIYIKTILPLYYYFISFLIPFFSFNLNNFSFVPISLFFLFNYFIWNLKVCYIFHALPFLFFSFCFVAFKRSFRCEKVWKGK